MVHCNWTHDDRTVQDNHLKLCCSTNQGLGLRLNQKTPVSKTALTRIPSSKQTACCLENPSLFPQKMCKPIHSLWRNSSHLSCQFTKHYYQWQWKLPPLCSQRWEILVPSHGPSTPLTSWWHSPNILDPTNCQEGRQLGPLPPSSKTHLSMESQPGIARIWRCLLLHGSGHKGRTAPNLPPCQEGSNW